jgi:hypothetical protein
MSINNNDYAFGSFAKSGFWFIKQEPDSVDSLTNYYAFGDKFGNFYIMKFRDNNGSGYGLYYKGLPTLDFDTTWASRESLTYYYPWEVFDDE